MIIRTTTLRIIQRVENDEKESLLSSAKLLRVIGDDLSDYNPNIVVEAIAETDRERE